MSDVEMNEAATGQHQGCNCNCGNQNKDITRLKNQVKRLESIAENVVYKDTEYRTRGDDGRYMKNHFHHDLDQDDDPSTGA